MPLCVPAALLPLGFLLSALPGLCFAEKQPPCHVRLRSRGADPDRLFGGVRWKGASQHPRAGGEPWRGAALLLLPDSEHPERYLSGESPAFFLTAASPMLAACWGETKP